MILSVCPNPCVDKTVFIESLNPGDIIRSKRIATVTGGKGCNVARAVHIFGRPTRCMMIVGGHTGAHVVEMLEEQDGVPCLPVWVDSPTRIITTLLEEPIHRQTAIMDPGSKVTKEELAKFIEAFEEAVEKADVVSFSGTVPDPSIVELYRDLIPRAKAQGAKVILDSHGEEFTLGLQAQPDMVKPNVDEAARWLGAPLDTDDAKWKAIDRFHEAGVPLVVLSLGKDGAFISQNGQRIHAVPPPIEEINPIGSGDALVAAFAIGLLEDTPLAETARLAIAAGTANASSWEIGHFTLEEVEQLAPQVQLNPR